ncbi:MAG: hypothetical protein A2W19_15640 [Spirochaetes bacterium RBG_16_49_21]|nr:MAG: hypothetical protein A2W19_15640 [Spirochaetes bacterium RBG_16_49_21]
MKKISLLIIFAAILSALAARAGGIGIYGTGGAGKGGWSGYGMGSRWLSRTLDAGYGDSSVTATFYGGGLIWDSAAAKDTIFNYRLKAGYERTFIYNREENAKSTIDRPIHRFSMTHTFGLGIVRNENIKFWMGPQIGLHYLRPTVKSTLLETDAGMLLYYAALPRILANNEFYQQIVLLKLIKINYKYDYIGLDLLWALGVNFNIGDYVTIFLDFGFGFMGNFSFKGNQKISFFGVQACAGTMFRINDKYRTSENIKIEIK